ncbi:TRAP transporter substrate-binding protein [Plastoroseomonas hellenica]|uniref:TRAP transporter substrate-binding protein n=1 Tax=Plastoroseomonas hellenica TaxID=2687306 RepID=UPI001BA5D15E|nr:TRAP transporter substrate-binding protein [Plastoroseomonas hellenica]MBR0645928.1 TRAP transporter substrate-binding protein [Plastoroseomonas hellenica]
MTTTRRTLFAAGLAAPAAILATRRAEAQTRWQMASAYSDANFFTRNIRTFLEEIQSASGGQLAIQLHSNASLLPMPQIKRGVQTGQVQLGEILLTAYANEDPFFDADAIPQLVTTYAQAKKLADLQKPYLEARLQRQGMMLLYTVPWPPAGLYAQQPITSVEQLRGSRFRTYSPMTNRFAALIGATPTLVQSAELAQAFATGIVQAQVTSAQTGVDTSAWDYARVFTPLGFTQTKNAVLISRRAFDGLPANQRTAITEAAARAETRGYELSEQATATTQRTLGERGMQIVPPTEQLLADLRRISATMTEEWIQRTGEDGRRLIEAYRA